MNIYPTPLAAKVAARNQLHQLIRHWVPRLHQVLAPFIGTRVVLAAGSLTAKVRKALPELPNTVDETVSLGADEYHVYARFKTCSGSPLRGRDGSCGAAYAEETVYLACLKCDSGTLEKLLPSHPESCRTDHTEAEIIAARLRLKQARAAVQLAENAVRPFGEYDR
jgi:hypothetical protein